MVLGNLHAWADHFISVDERLIERIAYVWPSCTSVLPSQPSEDTITINLVNHLCNDSIVRRICHWVEYQFEPFGINENGSKYSKGKIDIAILLDWNREQYVAYECKRLNVTHRGKRSSLATEYVSEGMMRFMKNQYADGLPIGCMLGYVIDGDLSFAMTQLNNAINSYKSLCLVDGPTTTATVQHIHRFKTIHIRTAKNMIELRHALLPFCIGRHKSA